MAGAAYQEAALGYLCRESQKFLEIMACCRRDDMSISASKLPRAIARKSYQVGVLVSNVYDLDIHPVADLSRSERDYLEIYVGTARLLRESRRGESKRTSWPRLWTEKEDYQ